MRDRPLLLTDARPGEEEASHNVTTHGFERMDGVLSPRAPTLVLRAGPLAHDEAGIEHVGGPLRPVRRREDVVRTGLRVKGSDKGVNGRVPWVAFFPPARGAPVNALYRRVAP